MKFQFFQESIDPKVEELIQASMEGKIEAVKKLIASGADVNGINPEYGDTALSQAAFKGHIDIVDFLLTQSPSTYSKNLGLLLACQAGHVIIVDKLLKHSADVNAYIENYHTPLFQVILQNKLDVFKRLLDEKTTIDINFEDPEGVIPLLFAAFNGRMEMFKELIDKGANLTITNKKGWTAESMAKQKNRSEILQYIEECKNIKSCTV